VLEEISGKVPTGQIVTQEVTLKYLLSLQFVQLSLSGPSHSKQVPSQASQVLVVIFSQ